MGEQQRTQGDPPLAAHVRPRDVGINRADQRGVDCVHLGGQQGILCLTCVVVVRDDEFVVGPRLEAHEYRPQHRPALQLHAVRRGDLCAHALASSLQSTHAEEPLVGVGSTGAMMFAAADGAAAPVGVVVVVGSGDMHLAARRSGSSATEHIKYRYERTACLLYENF